MNLHVGDLVKMRSDSNDLGVIVESKVSNQGLESMHVRHMMNSYPNVYYVYFSDGRKGPYYAGELTKLSKDDEGSSSQ